MSAAGCREIEVSRVALEEILPLRDLYRREMNCQIVHDSYHARGFTDSYAIRVDGSVVGYGSVAGLRGEPKETIKEFYLLSGHHAGAQQLFRHFVRASEARQIEAQTNDHLLTLMLHDSATGIARERILFHDAFTTALAAPGATFRRVTESDRARIFAHTMEPVGDSMIAVAGEVVATGGLMFHYNPPFGDLYMEVSDPFRRRGYGSFLVQELKRTCYALGRVPAARCDPSNAPSRATLQKAGLLPCASILSGTIVR